MTPPKFKDDYITREIIHRGFCYTIKDRALPKIKNDYQHVVFAVELNKENINIFKDLSTTDELKMETTKKSGFISVVADSVITTSADSFKSMARFLSIYERTEKSIDEFVDSVNIDQKSKSKLKKRQSIRR